MTKMKLEFAYTDEFGNKTEVIKEFDTWNETTLDTILAEVSYCLKACGFSPESLDERISYIR